MSATVVSQQPLTIATASFPSGVVCQPFPMQGSKRKQAPIIQRLVPADFNVFFEPFCGSAAVTLALRASGLRRPVCINDINSDISTLWSAIIVAPENLSDGYTRIWEAQFHGECAKFTSCEYFNSIRQHFNSGKSRSSEEFLFILNRIVKGALRYNQQGHINQSADRRRVGARPSIVKQRIMEAHELMRGVSVMNEDWKKCLAQVHPEDLIYLDPPYQGTTETLDKRYIEGMSYDVFRDGVENLIDCGHSAIISYDAIAGPVIYGRPLHLDLDLFAIDIITGLSSQGTLLGRSQEAHETLYLTPALVERLDGVPGVMRRLLRQEQEPLSDTLE